MKVAFMLLMGGVYISHINSLNVSLCQQQTWLPRSNPHAQRTQHTRSRWVHWHLGFCKNVFFWIILLLEGTNIKSILLTSFGSSPLKSTISPSKLMHHLSNCKSKILLFLNRLKNWKFWSFVCSPKSKQSKY